MSSLHTRFESKRQDWETPDELFDAVALEFKFTLDVCASETNAKVKTKFFTEADDALKQEWNGVCWMNPPFGSQGKWVKKAFEESLRGAIVVCLLPSRTNTNWWHDYCAKGEVRFIRGRPKFKGAPHGLPLPLALVIFRPPVELTDAP